MFSVDFAVLSSCSDSCDFTKAGQAYSSDGIKVDVTVKPDLLFPGYVWTTASRVAVHFRMVTRTKTFTLVNGTTPTADQNDFTVTDAANTASAVSSLDRTFTYATTTEGTPSTEGTVIVSQWRTVNSTTERDDNEVEAGDYSFFFYATFDVSPLTAKNLYWDPYFGVSGGDLGGAASAVVLNLAFLLLAVFGLLSM